MLSIQPRASIWPRETYRYIYIYIQIYIQIYIYIYIYRERERVRDGPNMMRASSSTSLISHIPYSED